MRKRRKIKLKISRRIALVMSFVMLFEVVFPSFAMALTSGPVQPEFTGFSPVQQTQMVDLFSGDFSYSIPLMEVPGSGGSFPLTLAYHSVTNMEEEASWVGLGWDLNIGAINREMRGIPDDFDGDKIKQYFDRKPHVIAGVTGKTNLEALGFDSDKLIPNLSFTLKYSNYKGYGWAIGAGLSANFKEDVDNKLASSFSLGFDSFEGANLGISLSPKGNNNGVGAEINSIEGLNRMNFSLTNQKIFKNHGNAFPKIQFLSNEFPDFYSINKWGTFGGNLTFGGKIGSELFFLFPNGTVSGFVSYNNLKRRKQWNDRKAFGSMHSEGGQTDKEAILDFTRHYDLPINRKQRNLAYPNANYDNFTISGQGLSGGFNLMRSDIGVFKTPNKNSENVGLSFGAEGGFGNLLSTGFDLEVNGGVTFENTEPVINGLPFKFQSKILEDYFEPYFFQPAGSLSGTTNASGEPIEENLESIKGDEPLKFKRKGTLGLDIDEPLLDKFNHSIVLNEGGKRKNRKPRSSVIKEFSNEELTDDNEAILLPEFNVSYKVWRDDQLDGNVTYLDTDIAVDEPLDRDHTDKKIGGFTYLDGSGNKFCFGLPVMNHKQVDVDFSVPQKKCSDIGSNFQDYLDTDFWNASASCDFVENNIGINYRKKDVPDIHQGNDNHINIKQIPEYASSHLLTSITGTNYIDSDLTDGQPNIKDKGYWMRFEYVKTIHSEDDKYFKWRVPFNGANHQGGFDILGEDDQASFTYGEREQFYVSKIISATHEAQIFLSPREDATGVNCWKQVIGDDLGALKYKVDSIQLKTRNNGMGEVLRTVVFEYDYSLCIGVLNSSTGSGKLTLKKVFFKNYQSSRGQLTPYLFQYNNSATYDLYKTDRWGVYNNRDLCDNINFPYTQQKGEEGGPTIEEIQRENVGAWHLSSITLPSGSTINIEIGRDHYAYVQDRVATQMMKIAGVGSLGEDKHKIPVVKASEAEEDDFKVFFELETPIDYGDEFAQAKLAKYFEDLYRDKHGKQIYFRVKTELLEPGQAASVQEIVNGYAHLVNSGEAFGLVDNGTDPYTHAWVKLQPFSEKIKNGKYHPFLVTAWQFLKLNFRQLILDGELQEPDIDFGNFAETAVELMTGVLTLIPEAFKLFKGYYKTCIDKKYGSSLTLSDSYIRLNSPDKLKYGDGVRVEKISMSTWDKEKTPEYGTVYDYTTEETIVNENGDTEEMVVSTGVAINEPFIGDEETAFKYGRAFNDDIRFGVDNVQIQEMPYGRVNYPGASVGYSKVRVRSLASDFNYKKFKGEVEGSDLYGIPNDESIKTAMSGEIVHEFYTAKDFPIIEKETNIDSKTFWPRIIPIPFVGSVTTDVFAGTQGYSLELNDMHGKQKKVTNYSQKKNGDIDEKPVSSVEYFYNEKEIVDNVGNTTVKRRVLENLVDLYMDYLSQELGDAEPGATYEAKIINGELGVQRQLFTDYQEMEGYNLQVGLAFNTDISIFFVFPIGGINVLPSVSMQIQGMKTGVTNKIIRRQGILKKIVAYDGQSKVETENLVFDPYSGGVVLSTVQNHFDNNVYNYSIPAYSAYPGMGPAYLDWKFTFILPEIESDNCSGYYKATGLTDAVLKNLFPGDEFIVERLDDGEKTGIKGLATYIRRNESEGEYIFDIPSTVYDNRQDYTYLFTNIRSGKRNQLSAQTQSIVALSNPTTGYMLNEDAMIPDTFGCAGLNNPLSFKVNDVLDASVSEYSEFWNFSLDELKSPVNKFQSGDRGIYRAKGSYKYLANRENEVNQFESSGIYDYFDFYNWKAPYYKFSDYGEKWVPTDEVTRYCNNGDPVESQDALGIHNTVLKSFLVIGENEDNTFPTNVTAEVSNAQYFESAFTSFEQYDANFQSSSSIRAENYCHFDLDSITVSYHQTFNIIGCLGQDFVNGTTNLIIDKPFTSVDDIPDEAEVYLSDFNEYYSTNMEVTSVAPIFLDNDFRNYRNRRLTDITLNSSGCEINNFNLSDNPALEGRMSLFYIFEINGDKNYDFSNGIAHTGKSSLIITDGSSSETCFPQQTLRLTSDKKYHFSCWVYTDDFKGDLSDEVTIRIKTGGNDFDFNPSGQRIDGWQRVEGEFEYQGAGVSGGHGFDFCIVNNLDEFLYIDDIRILPRNAQMAGYVFDSGKNRLSEILDANNYFTRYIYDGDGNLISIQKETERGLRTIQESRSYIVPTN